MDDNMDKELFIIYLDIDTKTDLATRTTDDYCHALYLVDKINKSLGLGLRKRSNELFWVKPREAKKSNKIFTFPTITITRFPKP